MGDSLNGCEGCEGCEASSSAQNRIQTLIFELRGYQRKYFEEHEDFTKSYEEVLGEIRELVKQYIYTKHQIALQMSMVMKEIISRYKTRKEYEKYIGDIMPIINGLVQSLLNEVYLDIYPNAWL